MATQMYVSDAQGFSYWQSSAYLDKNATSGNESAVFRDAQDDLITTGGVIPSDYNAANDIKVILHWASWAVTTGNVIWEVQFERLAEDGNSTTTSTWSAALSNNQACSGTLGALKYFELTFTNAQAAGVQPGESFRVRVTRPALTNPGGNDTMAGSAQLMKVILDEQN